MQSLDQGIFGNFHKDAITQNVTRLVDFRSDFVPNRNLNLLRSIDGLEKFEDEVVGFFLSLQASKENEKITW